MVRPKDAHDPKRAPIATNPRSFVTKDWVDTVFRTVDTPLRTHRITLSYSQFAVYLDTKLFRSGRVAAGLGGKAITVSNANWFNFATWGTYTLGPNIRNDGAPQRLDTLPNVVRRRVAPAIVQSRSAHGDVVGRALAWGQELIFLSASRALLHFATLHGRASDTQFRTPVKDRDQVLKAVNWNGHFIDEGHLELVDQAFDCYRLAHRRAVQLRRERKGPDEIQSDPFVAKLMFFATCLLTAAEQGVVNEALAVVIDSVPDRLMQGVDGKLSQIAHWRSGVPQQVAAYGLLARLQQAEGLLSESWARLMTRYLLVIVLPTEILRLGRDVPLRNPTEPMFPVPLMDLGQPKRVDMDKYEPKDDLEAVSKQLMALQQFVNALDRSQAGVGSAAHDWRRFDDRLNWAICLFRSRQQDRTLYWPPYSIEDTRRIVAGEMPRTSGHPGQAAVMPPLDPGSVLRGGDGTLLSADIKE
jgi:hypothetical protein